MRQAGETGNSLKMVFRNHPENERIVRTTAAVFVSILDPTLEEISEAIAAARVGKLDKPCVFFNLNGYYDAMKTMLDTMVAHDFLEAETAAKFLFTDDFSEIAAFLQSYEPPQLRRYR